jgi:hypothetical protein
LSLALQILVTGLAAGGVYGLLAAGLTFVYRLTGVVHFALGDLVGLAVFVTLLVAAGTGPVRRRASVAPDSRSRSRSGSASACLRGRPRICLRYSHIWHVGRRSVGSPGRLQCLWAGFSPGVRLLGVRPQLGLGHAAAALPLRLAVRASGDEVVLTLRNTTSVRVQTASARGGVPTLTRVLGLARRGIYPHGGVGVSVLTPVLPRTAVVEAPLAVHGEVTVRGGGRRQFALVLGDGRPLRRVLRFSGAAPVIHLTVEPVLPRRTLAVGPKPDAGRLLDVAEDAYLRAARVHQYETYLANPGLGRVSSSADYTYRSAAPHAAPGVARHDGAGLGTIGLVLVIAGAVVLAGSAVVVWAQL